MNAVGPGVIETPLFGKLGLTEANAEELARTLLQQIPAKRLGKPEAESCCTAPWHSSLHTMPRTSQASNSLWTAAAPSFNVTL